MSELILALKPTHSYIEEGDVMHTHILPHTYVALRLPSESLKVVQLVPNTYVA